MIDVHCHLNFHAYEKDVDAVITEAFQKGVKKIINVGTKLDSSAKAIELAEKYDNLYAIVGVHPHHADKLALNHEAEKMMQDSRFKIQEKKVTGARGDTPGKDSDSAQPRLNRGSTDGKEPLAGPRADYNTWIKELEILARHPKVLAIGEIGMDYYSYQSNGIVDPKLQKEIFEAQIDLAHRLNLPLQIHNRHAGKDVIEILTYHKNILKTDKPGMFHCFAGDMEVLKGALDLGFYIGFDGNITYPGLAPKETVSLSDLAKATPLDRIVTETDSPFLTPVPFRGSRNNPSHVIIVGEFLAKLKGTSFEEMQQNTVQNAKELFGI